MAPLRRLPPPSCASSASPPLPLASPSPPRVSLAGALAASAVFSATPPLSLSESSEPATSASSTLFLPDAIGSACSPTQLWAAAFRVGGRSGCGKRAHERVRRARCAAHGKQQRKDKLDDAAARWQSGRYCRAWSAEE
eukprot:365196-Chlamydomonas_euryale.AAC.10